MAKVPTDAVAFYSHVAESFHESYRADANRLERVRVWREYFDRYMGDARFGYDLGCGSGILACELAARGIEIVGIDGAENMLAIAETSAREKQLSNVTFKKQRLPIADTSQFREADAIISSSALEYLDSMPEALSFVHKMLRPGGTLIFSVSNYDSLSRKGVRAVHSITGLPRYFGLVKQFMTVEALQADLSGAGFSYLQHTYFGKADRINRTLGIVASDRYASNMIVVAARRD